MLLKRSIFLFKTRYQKRCQLQRASRFCCAEIILIRCMTSQTKPKITAHCAHPWEHCGGNRTDLKIFIYKTYCVRYLRSCRLPVFHCRAENTLANRKPINEKISLFCRVWLKYCCSLPNAVFKMLTVLACMLCLVSLHANYSN